MELNLDPNYLLASLIFGLFGTAYFLYGRKQSKLVPLICGIVLAVFPYFITNLKIMIPIGIAFILMPAFVKD